MVEITGLDRLSIFDEKHYFHIFQNDIDSEIRNDDESHSIMGKGISSGLQRVYIPIDVEPDFDESDSHLVASCDGEIWCSRPISHIGAYNKRDSDNKRIRARRYTMDK